MFQTQSRAQDWIQRNVALEVLQEHYGLKVMQPDTPDEEATVHAHHR